MSDFLKETLTNPTWWFTVIVVGLLVSIVGNKLTDPVSNWLGTFITSIRLRNEEKRAKLDAKVQYLLSHPHEELVLRLENSRRYLENSVLLVSLILLLVTCSGIYLIIIVVSANMDLTWEEQIFGTVFVHTNLDTLKVLFSILAVFLFALLNVFFVYNDLKRSPIDKLIKEIDRIREENARSSDN